MFEQNRNIPLLPSSTLVTTFQETQRNISLRWEKRLGDEGCRVPFEPKICYNETICPQTQTHPPSRLRRSIRKARRSVHPMSMLLWEGRRSFVSTECWNLWRDTMILFRARMCGSLFSAFSHNHSRNASSANAKLI